MTTKRKNMQAIKKTRELILRWEQVGMSSLTEARIYLYLHETGPQRISDVADGCSLPMSTASRILYGLSQLELVVYEPSPDDRRSSIVKAV